ncbi:type II toxin-antitoxin system RelE/ParE family toxin [uncultured Polaribacter sp.]|uniref:type II toxin-antitoxin system RelE/ParE family toxin n=1 Tax=uncultured Polaribacter sp. TaxID=174711 RepID=UPI002632C674|nr:type II toxin-antitoxin system RelE/ParE family toxin [uncultured Polaribacter sp.]
MAKLILRQEAIDDLTNIWKYTVQNWSKNQADKYFGKIKSACIDIFESAVIGKKYDKIEINLLGHKVEKHIIFYRTISESEIEVIRILHERMDLKNKLRD